MNYIAIVGRANVGKSTLFNRIAGKKLALVYDFPGVTRDRKQAKCSIGDFEFILVDTPGFGDPLTPSGIAKAMEEQTLKSLEQADLILFLVDGKAGCTSYDREFSKIIHKKSKKTLLIVNKSDATNNFDNAFYQLGFRDVLLLSAAHGNGVQDLYQSLLSSFPSDKEEKQNLDEGETDEGSGKVLNYPLKLSIIGRPNVGKSTLVNTLLQEERLLVGDMPGVTRDAIEVEWIYKDRRINLVDTAGVRRKSKINDTLEKLSISDCLNSVRFAEMVVLVIDASNLMENLIEKQDLILASYVLEEGRGLVIALNKSDMVKNLKGLMNHVQHQLDDQLSQAQGIPCVPISGKKNRNLNALLDAVLQMEKNWNKRIPTGALNRWLGDKITTYPPPIVSGKRLRLKYMTQVKGRPPSFAVFGNKGLEFPESYKRYLVNNLRKDFDLYGVPIRLSIRSPKNPFKRR